MSELTSEQLEELFGSDVESINEEGSEPPLDLPTGQVISEKFKAVPGLRLLRQGLSHAVQSTLLDFIIAANYFQNEKTNQAMHFGDLPESFAKVGSWAKSCTDLLNDIDRQPLFDQAIINLYRPGEGIRSHVDLQKFDDGVLIISLLSSCVMIMTPASEELKNASSYQNEEIADNEGISVHLRPGDVLALTGSARWDWAHGIPAREIDVIHGEPIHRGSRVSITLRKLKCSAAGTVELGQRS
ncbi:hypothetical protein NQZ79_g8883 [Umbelopsis isabellina]|nr:hypothetical protein NQZ79_g8883 [Umbelopsis isabellina]